uniref:Leukotriene B4 receptor 1-like n=1 Tax=Haplochromis burtoni TaxID=8153 RepID=A0A3Q2VSM3_HAPBU
MASNTNSTTSTSPHMISAQIGIGILTLAFVLGFPGNLFVVWSVVCRVKKRSVTCLLVLNLAVADALVLLSAPFFLRYLAGGRGWEFGSAACKLMHYLSSVNMYVSIYLICLMSMDRCLAVTRPFVSQKIRTKRSLLFLLLGVWILAFLLSLFFSHSKQLCINIIYCCGSVKESELILMDIFFFLFSYKTYKDNLFVVSAVNPILYVFAGSSHIRQAGFSFMGKLFEGTNSESRTTSFSRSGRSSSSPDESSVLHTLSVKMGKPFKSKNRGESRSAVEQEIDAPELKTLATFEQ